MYCIGPVSKGGLLQELVPSMPENSRCVPWVPNVPLHLLAAANGFAKPTGLQAFPPTVPPSCAQSIVIVCGPESDGIVNVFPPESQTVPFGAPDCVREMGLPPSMLARRKYC